MTNDTRDSLIWSFILIFIGSMAFLSMYSDAEKIKEKEAQEEKFIQCVATPGSQMIISNQKRYTCLLNGVLLEKP